MNAAFGFFLTSPAAGAQVFTGPDSTRTGRAADRRIALFDQWMRRQIAPIEFLSYLLWRPMCQWIDLVPAIHPFDGLQTGPVAAVMPLAAADPAVKAFERLFQR